MLANGHKGTKPASALAAAPTPLAICPCKQQFPVPCTSHRAEGFVYALQELAAYYLEVERVVRIGELISLHFRYRNQFLAQVTNPQVFVNAS
jgi:hypothetical protein